MMKQRTIFSTIHGSHLYGTSTPTSDEDFKSVHLPGGREILLQKAVGTISSGPEKAPGEKNQAGDVDDSSFSLHKLMSMISVGDIIGVELLFIPTEFISLATDDWYTLLSYRDSLMCSEIKGYVGYCQKQAAKYGIRGSRVAALRKTLELFDSLIATSPTAHLKKVGDFPHSFEELAHSEEHISIIPIFQPGTGKWMNHLEVCNRKAPYTITLKEARAISQRAFDEYGARSLAAENNEGVDWKAVSHAIRVGGQAIELLETGNITFPRPNADWLRDIKLGKMDYKDAAKILEATMEVVEEKQKMSRLPPVFNKELSEHIICNFYREQVENSNQMTF